jgi:hypothetical protein
MNNNEISIVNGTHVIPEEYNGGNGVVSVLGGESRSSDPTISSSVFIWGDTITTSSLVDERRLVALSTCNGCHYFETHTNNFHIAPRPSGSKAGISAFLSGNLMHQSILTEDNQPLFFDEPLRRKCELMHAYYGNPETLTSMAGRPH